MADMVYMCRPCAEKLKAEGKLIIRSSVKGKDICPECNRSRFRYECERIAPAKPKKPKCYHSYKRNQCTGSGSEDRTLEPSCLRCKWLAAEFKEVK